VAKRSLRAAALALTAVAFCAPAAFASTDPIALAIDACVTLDGDTSAIIAMAEARGWRSLTSRELEQWADPSFDGMHTMTGWMVESGDSAIALIFGEYLHASDAMRSHAASGATVVPLAEDAQAFALSAPRLAQGTVCAVRFRAENAPADINALRGLSVDGAPLGDPYLDATDPSSDEDARFWGRRGFRTVVWQRSQDPTTITYVGSSRGGVIRVYGGGR
jgi:hypothetical protein